MPPVTTDNVKLSLKLGTAVAVAIACAGLIWRVSAGWTQFITSFDNFKGATEAHFSSIEHKLETNHSEIVSMKDDVNILRTRQNNVLGDRWTGTNQKDWAYELDKTNRTLDSGKGLNVPDPSKFISQKKPEN